jgi:hypothetical protein
MECIIDQCDMVYNNQMEGIEYARIAQPQMICTIHIAPIGAAGNTKCTHPTHEPKLLLDAK